MLVKQGNVKATAIDCQAAQSSGVYGQCMQNGLKSEGWLLTDRASWRHNNGGVDTQKEQIKTKTYTNTQNKGKRNRTNNKIRQKEIKVRMNDVSGANIFLAQGRHGRKDPVALVC